MNCPLGWSSEKGSSKCLACDAGKFQTKTSEVKSVMEGKMQEVNETPEATTAGIQTGTQHQNAQNAQNTQSSSSTTSNQPVNNIEIISGQSVLVDFNRSYNDIIVWCDNKFQTMFGATSPPPAICAPIFRMILQMITSIKNSDIIFIETRKGNILPCRHKNIVQLIGACSNPPMLVLAFASNGTLRDLLSNNHLLPSRLMELIHGICDGMTMLHSQNILHLARSGCIFSRLPIVLVSYSFL